MTTIRLLAATLAVLLTGAVATPSRAFAQTSPPPAAQQPFPEQQPPPAPQQAAPQPPQNPQQPQYPPGQYPPPGYYPPMGPVYPVVPPVDVHAPQPGVIPLRRSGLDTGDIISGLLVVALALFLARQTLRRAQADGGNRFHAGVQQWLNLVEKNNDTVEDATGTLPGGQPASRLALALRVELELDIKGDWA